MTGKILTIAQQKGGAGKSTLAAHLALAWALKRKSVALVDIDPQQSLAAWYDQREITLGADQTQITFASATGWRAAGVVEKLAKTHDYVLIDSPPMLTPTRVSRFGRRILCWSRYSPARWMSGPHYPLWKWQ